MAVIKALPAQTLTFEGAETLVAGDFVEVDGNMHVAKVTDGTESIGAVVVGPDEFGYVTVLLNKPILQVTVSAQVAAGDKVQAGANHGEVDPLDTANGGVEVGVVVQGAAAGDKALVAFTA